MNLSDEKLQTLPSGVELYQMPGTQFTTDSLHLANALDMPCGSYIAELGCGTGGVMFSAALKNPGCKWLGLDIQEDLLKFMMHSAILQTPKIELTAICCDVKDVPRLMQGSIFDAVAVNPPFKVAGTGRESPIPRRNVSRFGSSLLVYQFIRAAAHLLVSGGVFLIAGRTEMIPKIMLGCETYNLQNEQSCDNIMKFIKH